MSDDNNPHENLVGYCSPPEKNKFKKGQSGNPLGRPRRTNFHDDFLDELDQLVEIMEGGKRYKVTKRRALVKSHVALAVKGDVRCAKLIISIEEKSGRVKEDPTDQKRPSAILILPAKDHVLDRTLPDCQAQPDNL